MDSEIHIMLEGLRDQNSTRQEYYLCELLGEIVKYGLSLLFCCGRINRCTFKSLLDEIQI